ncbi:MAG: type I phosphomannose isomerase catalytic subunit [Thermomicrobiales bacterium]
MMHVSIVVPRLDEKPWGGRSLERFGFDLPAGVPIGEALVTANDARVTAGFGAGFTLGELVAKDPERLLGARAAEAVSGRTIFPLLVKLIDAAENLSIQVHPDDSQAVPLDRLGKTEAWHILHAEPGAVLYVGLLPGVSQEDFAASARAMDGSSAALMRALEPQPGTTILIPAGTIHALGAGVMVYEIQQPSDVTFRIDDWGRVDAEGNPRQMHFDDGFAVTRADVRPAFIAPVPVEGEGAVVRRALLVATRYFALERIDLEPGSSLDLAGNTSPQVLTVLRGGLAFGQGDGTTVELLAGHSAVLWPAAADDALAVDAATATSLLRAWVPDLGGDIVGVARASGAADASILALGGDVSDVGDALGQG